MLLDGLQYIREKQIFKRIVEQPRGHDKQPRTRVIRKTKVLQGTEVVGVADGIAKLLIQGPVAIALGVAEFVGEARAQISGETIVVQQRVIDVQ
jgi:hypothetical protein